MTEADRDAILAATEPSPDYPTLDCALACPDCAIIFREGSCPKCGGSVALLNVGAVLSRHQPQVCDGCGVPLVHVPLHPLTRCSSCIGAML